MNTSRLLRSIRTILKNKEQKKITIGVFGVLMVYMAIALTLSATWPWWSNRGDGPFHIDYAHQLYNGSLPSWSEGIQYPKFKEFIERPGTGYPGDYKHIASPHPPLYYAILAPVIGPLMNSGEWEKAFAAGRAITTIIGAAIGVAIAYGASLVRIKERRRLIVLAPLFALLLGPVVAISRDPQNDLLVTFFASLMFILVYKLYKDGVSWQNVTVFCIVSVLGMLSKATFIGVLAPSYIVLAYAAIRNSSGFSRRRIAAYLVAPVMAVLLLSGWFYIGNYMQSGDFSRAGSQDWVGHRREAKSLKQLLTTPPFYDTFFGQLTVAESNLSRVITICSIVSLLYLSFVYKERVGRALRNNLPLVVAGMVSFLLFVLIQIKHAIPYGMYNIRYFLPLLLPASIIFAFAVMRLPWLHHRWNILVALLMGSSLVKYTSLTVRGSNETGVMNLIQAGLYQNSVPSWFLILMCTVGALGVAAITYSLLPVRHSVAKANS